MKTGMTARNNTLTTTHNSCSQIGAKLHTGVRKTGARLSPILQVMMLWVLAASLPVTASNANFEVKHLYIFFMSGANVATVFHHYILGGSIKFNWIQQWYYQPPKIDLYGYPELSPGAPVGTIQWRNLQVDPSKFILPNGNGFVTIYGTVSTEATSSMSIIERTVGHISGWIEAKGNIQGGSAMGGGQATAASKSEALIRRGISSSTGSIQWLPWITSEVSGETNAGIMDPVVVNIYNPAKSDPLDPTKHLLVLSDTLFSFEMTTHGVVSFKDGRQTISGSTPNLPLNMQLAVHLGSKFRSGGGELFYLAESLTHGAILNLTGAFASLTIPLRNSLSDPITVDFTQLGSNDWGSSGFRLPMDDYTTQLPGLGYPDYSNLEMGILLGGGFDVPESTGVPIADLNFKHMLPLIWKY